MHGIGGLSSGAICAFIAAWEQPEYFHKVLSHIGSYTNIRGGNKYPFLIRKHKRKDIKIFMQDGSNDFDNEHGDWWLANLKWNLPLSLRIMNSNLKRVAEHTVVNMAAQLYRNH